MVVNNRHTYARINISEYNTYRHVHTYINNDIKQWAISTSYLLFILILSI